MKRLIYASMLLVLTSGCGVSIKSVVDNSVANSPYTNPLIVIPYESGVTKNFVHVLKQKIEEKFLLEQKKVDIILFEKSNDELKLNNNTDINQKIDAAIISDKKDLILIFRPTKLQFYNGGLQTATYLITGVDASTKKEVWKAEFESSSSFGPSLFAEKAAASIYEKLKTDKVI